MRNKYEAVINGMRELGYKGNVIIKAKHGRKLVYLNGKMFGIWDDDKNTFVA